MTPDEVRAARKTLGLNQAEFAELLGVSRKMTVSQWETGAHAVSDTVALLIQAYLDGWKPGMKVSADLVEARKGGAQRMLDALTYPHDGARFVAFNENTDLLQQPGVLAALSGQ